MSSSPIPDQARSISSTSQDTAMRQPTAPVLGTPWTRSATKVALLGAGEIGKEVTIALSRLGVEVTAARHSVFITPMKCVAGISCPMNCTAAGMLRRSNMKPESTVNPVILF